MRPAALVVDELADPTPDARPHVCALCAEPGVADGVETAARARRTGSGRPQ